MYKCGYCGHIFYWSPPDVRHWGPQCPKCGEQHSKEILR
jgi:DNA-directed RNA polymerase subunit RPC12/RpoP